MSSSTRSREEREKAVQDKMAAVKRKNRNRILTLIISGSVIALALITVVIVVLVQAGRTAGSAGGDSVPAPTYVASASLEVTDRSVILGEQDAPHTFTIYEDPLCPFCGLLEADAGPEFDSMIENGEARVEYITVAYLDAASSDGRYSTRVASLLAHVAQTQPEVWSDVHAVLYAQQPAEGSTLTDEELLSIVENEGVNVDEVTRSAVESIAYGNWVADVTESASQDNITGTPTVLLDGEVVQVRNGPDARRALDAVSSS